MKKLISLLLVICILCPLLAGCGNRDEDFKMKKAYLRQFEIEGKEPEDVIIDYDGGEYNGTRIVMLDVEWHDPEEWTETVDGVEIKYYDSNRLYAYKNGKFFTLTDAYDKNKLSREDIVAIGEGFNKKVTHFIDICDKYDFPEGKILEVPETEKEYIHYRSIRVYFAPSLIKTAIKESGKGYATTLMEYLGCDMITEIGILNGFFNHPEFPDYGAKLAVALLREETKECAEYVMNEIVEIPGVIGVSFAHPIDIPAESTNGGTYLSSECWWIDDIQVEKVWEFTKGSSFFLTRIGKYDKIQA